MRHSFIFKNRANSIDHLSHQQWQWPSCKQRKITNNSVSSDPPDEIIETPETSSAKSTSEYHYNCGFLNNDSLESIIKGVQLSSCERLFFEPQETNSLSRGENNFEGEVLPFKESVAVLIESKDPYGEFKKSMQEMIGTHGLNDLEKLLRWYLKVNDKRQHGFIVEAFVDIFLELATSPASSTHSSSTVFSAEPC